jgi:hypothetical protein
VSIQFPLGNLVITEILPTKSLDGHSQLGPKKIVNALYLGRESAKESKMMARFRRGKDERENRCWMELEERRCRMCYKERETIEHMWSGCSEMRERNGEKYGMKTEGI